MYTALATLALTGLSLAAALPQAPSAPSTGGPIERSGNFTISIFNNPKAGLNGFALQQGHIAAGQNALIFERPSTYPPYTSYLSGTEFDLSDQHAFLFQYLPGAGPADAQYGVKVPTAGKSGELALVTGEPGNQTEQFGVDETTKALTYYTFEQDAAFFACADSIAGIDNTLFLKYGTAIEDKDIPAGCDKIQMYVDFL